MTNHPFLDKSFFVKWSELTPEHIQPDIDRALSDAQENLEAICGIPLEEISYEKVLVGLEKATEALDEAWGKVSHLTSVSDSEALRAVYNELLPKVSEFYARIPLNDKLWAALKAFSETSEAKELEGVRKRFYDETLADFRQSGADLPQEKKKRLEAIVAELARITQEFSENVLDSTNAWELVLEDDSRLGGLPESAKEAARQNALSKGHGSEEKPVYRFTLQYPSMEPVMTYAEDGDLRKEMWTASIGIGAKEPHDNTVLILRILELRQEKAQLLGNANFADHVLERRMAKNGKTALDFVDDLHARVKAAFDRECRELEIFKAAGTGEERSPLEPWEVGYWAEKLRKERYDFDEEELRPYFPMDKVVSGLFEIAQKVFSISIREHKGESEGWHSEVKVYEIEDVSLGDYLGAFYTDWHPRESKRGGAWMNSLLTGGPRENGNREPHLGLMCGNMTAPIGEEPALLTHREVETIFHEFGHLIHHLLGEVEIKSLNGTNVAWDFVELPSQIMENWTWDRDSLNLFARHHKTGEIIPDELYKKMVAARNFFSAIGTMRQLSFGKVDLEMHLNPSQYTSGDIDAMVEELLEDYRMPTKTLSPSIIRRFGHLFADPVGYAAGYYSYKWAEVLDADAFTRFEKEGVFDASVGAEFREHILSKGNSEDPMTLFKRFMGREPDLNALLIRSGLIAVGE
jgi:oligopeptidase A